MYRSELGMCTRTIFALMGKRRASFVRTTGKRNIAAAQHLYQGNSYQLQLRPTLSPVACCTSGKRFTTVILVVDSTRRKMI